MDFKKYIELNRKEAHQEILIDICPIINNCANCYDETKRTTVCNCIQCMDIINATATSFYLEAYNSDVNNQLKQIAESHKYNFGIVLNDDCTLLKFYK